MEGISEFLHNKYANKDMDNKHEITVQKMNLNPLLIPISSRAFIIVVICDPQLVK